MAALSPASGRGAGTAGPRLIAHRGASGLAPENTLAAFEKALELGAEAIEFDAQQTRDGVPVVIHDTGLERVAGVRRRVREVDYAELSGLDAGAWFAPRFKSQRVPRVEEVLDLAERAAPGRVELHLEIKQARPPYAGIEARILELLKAREVWDGRVVVSSFHHRTLHRLRSLDARLRLGYLVADTARRDALREATALRCESVHLSRRRVNADWVRSSHAEGLRLLVYTVNAGPELARLRALGVDAVFTDFPRLREVP